MSEFSVRLDLDALERTAERMTRKGWTDAQSQAFDDSFRPSVALQLVRDLRDAERNGRHAREAWGKAEARLLVEREAAERRIAKMVTEDGAAALIATLLAALKELHLKAVVGTDDERHAALNGAWAAISEAEGET